MTETIDITFSDNWNNKLKCPAFTTLRLDGRKYTIGTRVRIKMKGQLLSNYFYLIKSKRVITIDQINDFISYLDTGYSVAETQAILRKMYKVDWRTQKLAFVLLLRTAEMIDNQTQIGA